MVTQLTFDLPAAQAFARADFFVSAATAQVLTVLDGWRDWPDGKMLLVGPEGAGKTHLAHIWADMAGAVTLRGADLATANLPELAQVGAVCVEDAEAVAGNPLGQTALFHLHNLLVPSGRLLITAATPPRDWGLTLPDLHSRLQATALTTLAAPDDALLAAVLIKLFADRQITVPPNLIPYLVSRMERSIGTARLLVAQLDAAALTMGRPVTRALAAQILDKSPEA